MLGNQSLFHPPKLKLKKDEWAILKSHVPNLDIHHEMGKGFEQLCCLKVLPHDEHLKDHHKYIHGLPYARAILNLAYWVQILGDDFEYFAENDLLGI